MAWDAIRQAIAADFADLSTLEPLVHAVLRLALACILGGCLGFQRERDGKQAGTRTHMLVAASSALLMLVTQELYFEDEPRSRVIQGLLSGIGFVCAGAILKLPREQQVQGLTTSAGIWMTAAIGIAIGLGLGWTAVLGTLLVLAILALDKTFRHLAGRRR